MEYYEDGRPSSFGLQEESLYLMRFVNKSSIGVNDGTLEYCEKIHVSISLWILKTYKSDVLRIALSENGSQENIA